MPSKRHYGRVIAGILMSLAFASSARAGSFTLTPSYPDLTGFFVGITYSKASGVLTACGYTNALATDPTTTYNANSVPCEYGLKAFISSTGSFTPNLAGSYDSANCLPAMSASCSSSSISIAGGLPTYDTDPATPGTQPIPDNSLLLDGNLTDFDFTPGNQAANSPTIFRFLVAVMDDPEQLGFGSLAGAILTTTDIYATGFTKDFAGTGYIDTFYQAAQVPIPEPGTLMLVGVGAAALLRRRCSRKRSR